MKRTTGSRFTPIALLGVIAVIAILAAILFPPRVQAREKPGRAARPGTLARFVAAGMMDTPALGYDALRSALTTKPGKALVLDFQEGTSIPALRPVEPWQAVRPRLCVCEDGRIQNLLLGDFGYLTRVASGSGKITVRFAAFDPRDRNQVWNFMKGPARSRPGQAVAQNYTLVVAPVSANDRSVRLLTATGVDGQIVIKERNYPIPTGELNRLPLAQRWDFLNPSDSPSQIEALYQRDNLLLPYAMTCQLRLSTSWRGSTGCSSFQHVADACDSSWHNPACGGDPNTWLNTCTLLNGKCTCSHK